MKQIKYSIIALGALALLASCNKTDLTPATGNTPVEFPEAVQVFNIENEYFEIPVFQTAKSDKATEVNLKIVSCTGAYINGQEFNWVEDSTVMFTSQHLYVGPWNEQDDSDTTFGTSSFELRLPQYTAIDSLVMELQLEGDYLGNQTTTTCIFRSVDQYDMIGTFYFNGNSQQCRMTITSANDASDPNAYNVSFPIVDNNPAQFKATRSINRLIIDSDTYTSGGDLFTLYSLVWLTEEDGASEEGWYLSESDVEIRFTSDNDCEAVTGLAIINEDQTIGFDVAANAPGVRLN